MGTKCEHSDGHENQLKWIIGTHGNWKFQNPGSRFGATSQIALPSQPIHQKNEANWLTWQGCLAGSSKTAPRILKISIVMGADYWSELIFMPTWVLAFCALNNSCLDRVNCYPLFLRITMITDRAHRIYVGIIMGKKCEHSGGHEN